MIREFLAQSNLLLLPQIALLVFFLTFVAVLVRVFLARRRGEDDSHMARLPLDPEETSDSRRPVR